MATEQIMVLDERANLKNYEEALQTMDWRNVEQQFTWSETGKVNIVYEAIDRHVVEGRGERVALHYTDGSREESYTFKEMMQLSSSFANGLRSLGVQKGDRVFLFMPRSPELYIALIGILRLGAIAGPLFEAFMEEAVKDRLEDSGAKVVVTTSALVSRIRSRELPQLQHVILADAVEKTEANQILYRELMAASDAYTIEWVDREDGMILNYTSGSTGKP
ncbi:AMP-binding enzyme [Brevibacillus centrosporus]|uniref:AMP-binding enzyme n=1 Tax=Brevibacillus centrosporus TaxID=54910 RepID=A0A1I3SD47_9BACL|nr:AMP-binding enzyme [Brevibacillus centrosporus]